MIEHRPWVGSKYRSDGIRGQRIGIVGYSHWNDDDNADFTIECIEKVISGEWNIAFFNSIAGYFGMTRADFYDRIVMFEFVPCAIGGPSERYAWATKEQARAGGERMLRIAKDEEIEKLFVFTSKGWKSAPETIEEAEGIKRLLGATKFQVGRYNLGGREVTAIGLRHPQYAPNVQMREAVALGLAL